MVHILSDKKRIFSKLPHFLQLPVAKAYCKHKKKWVQHLETPTTLIFFVTSRCNLRCSHCFYWQEINKPADDVLAIEEIHKISTSFSRPLYLSLTGGEPFLRKDLFEIIWAFYAGCGTREVGITTNGTLQEATVQTVLSVLERGFLANFSIQVSLDGLEKTHDRIRGVTGAFSKALSTLKELCKIQKHYPQLSLKTCLSVQKQNLSELGDYVEHLLPLGIPLRFNIVRGGNFGVFRLPKTASSSFDPKNKPISFLSPKEINEAYCLLKKLSDENSFHFWPPRQQRIWELSIKMLETHHSEIPCYARFMESVLFANGDTAFCELSKPFGNIRAFDYDFKKIWQSDEADRMRKLLSRCSCIHGCNLTTGLAFEPDAFVSTLLNRSMRGGALQ
jgi:MoaA/NifB/PqqE/SkfB family radical SAM enzyme